MFFTYIYRELRRRHRQALLTALGLAVGVGLVVAVTAYAGGVSKAQDEVLHSLYGVGTDITVTQTAKLDQGGPMQFGMDPGDQDRQGKKFSRDQLRSSPGQQSMAAATGQKVGRPRRRLRRRRRSGARRATHVEGKFAQAFSQRRVAARLPRQSGGRCPQPSASQAPIRISSFSLSGVDVTDSGLGPLSSSEVVSGRSFTLVRLERQGRARRQGLRQAAEPDGGRHDQGRRHEVRGRRHRDLVQRHVLDQRLHPLDVGAEAQRQHRARSTRSTCGPTAPTRSPPSRRRSRRRCPRRR